MRSEGGRLFSRIAAASFITHTVEICDWDGIHGGRVYFIFC